MCLGDLKQMFAQSQMHMRAASRLSRSHISIGLNFSELVMCVNLAIFMPSWSTMLIFAYARPGTTCWYMYCLYIYTGIPLLLQS